LFEPTALAAFFKACMAHVVLPQNLFKKTAKKRVTPADPRRHSKRRHEWLLLRVFAAQALVGWLWRLQLGGDKTQIATSASGMICNRKTV
jgi:hypothetical protein